MKKTIGICAYVVAAIGFVIWVALIMGGKPVAKGGGLKPIAIIAFCMCGAGGAVGRICLQGEMLRYAGKNFGAGLRSQGNEQPTTVRVCSSCGKTHEPGMKFCPHCGAAQAGKVVCLGCGKTLNGEAFCPNCGTANPQKRKS